MVAKFFSCLLSCLIVFKNSFKGVVLLLGDLIGFKRNCGVLLLVFVNYRITSFYCFFQVLVIQVIVVANAVNAT